MTVTVTFIPNPLLEEEWNHSEAAAGMMLSIGERIMMLATANAPVDTGALARSIEMYVDEDEMGRPQAIIGSQLRYAGFVEYGTSIMAAQPYLRPALDEVI